MLLNDTEAKVDLLNFSATANAVATMIRLSEDEPLSIGVFGDWGSGKSSLVHLIGSALRQNNSDEKEYVFINFNAWLYQGFDDAKMALLQSVSDELLEVAKKHEGLKEKVLSFLRRIKYLRTAKLMLSAIGGAMAGGAVAGPVGSLAGLATSVASADWKSIVSEATEAVEGGEKAVNAVKSCLKDAATPSLPQEIAELRTTFGEILSAAGIRLVILVDDLDRCLPETMVSTLEAMRLLLFTNRTVFIIAADETAIKNAVRLRYDAVANEEKLVGSYFDKLIQIPVAVPHPSHNEIRCYLTALLAETARLQGKITQEELIAGCNGMAKLLSAAWLGRVTTKEIDSAFGHAASALREEIGLAEQMVSVMAIAETLSGNPRLMKRFVNAAVIRRTIAEGQGVGCPLDALLKIMLLERCAKKDVFGAVHREVLESDDGVSKTIQKWECACEDRSLSKGEDNTAIEKWVAEWARLPPRLSEMDLRPMMYLSRDVASWNYSVGDELSHDGCEVFRALLASETLSEMLARRIRDAIMPEEASLILRKLFVKVKDKNDGSALLCSALTIPEAFPQLRKDYITSAISLGLSANLPPSIVPYLAQWDESKEFLQGILGDTRSSKALKRAIQASQKRIV